MKKNILGMEPKKVLKVGQQWRRRDGRRAVVVRAMADDNGALMWSEDAQFMVDWRGQYAGNRDGDSEFDLVLEMLSGEVWIDVRLGGNGLYAEAAMKEEGLSATGDRVVARVRAEWIEDEWDRVGDVDDDDGFHCTDGECDDNHDCDEGCA